MLNAHSLSANERRLWIMFDSRIQCRLIVEQILLKKLKLDLILSSSQKIVLYDVLTNS